MTWSVLNTLSIDGKTYALFGADNLTNPYVGDTAVGEVRSLLCIKKSNLPIPSILPAVTVTAGGAQRGSWTGGKVTIVPNLSGNTLTSQAIANEKCRLQGLQISGEDGFQMAEFHDGGTGAGWDFWAEVPATDLSNLNHRFWVSINDQPANPF